MGTRVGRLKVMKAASIEQQLLLSALHVEVYGYVTADTADRIAGMTWLRAAQETATLQRAMGDRDALTRQREELKLLHRICFGPSFDAEKRADIDTYDAHRVATEILTLNRMRDTQIRQSAVQARVRAPRQSARRSR